MNLLDDYIFPSRESTSGNSTLITKLPFVDDILSSDSWIRTFNPCETNNSEYVWHRDRKDREVIILDGIGWSFQLDNELPFNINIGEKIFIPKMVYHRILPGKTILRIRIHELD